MGFEAEEKVRAAASSLTGESQNSCHCRAGAVFMHCLPAHAIGITRKYSTAAVGRPRSIRNRMYVQKAILHTLF